MDCRTSTAAFMLISSGSFFEMLLWCLVDRYREQAHSYKGTHFICRSEPARDEGLPYTAVFMIEGCARITHNP
ncbi:hypothetical protein EMIT0215P_10437 [Pseudomonas serboccidentalis]